jgi:4'-phosphopantetheinyl transferase
MKNLSGAWLFDLSSLYDETLENFPTDILATWLSKLSPAEQQRANSFTHAQRRLSYIASHALAYSLLEVQFSKTAQQWQIASEGQPLVSSVSRVSNTENSAELSNDFPNISLSHSGSWIMCAIADSNALIGCDIETHKTRVNIDAIAKSFFTEAETQLLTALNSAEKELFFYRLWTAKEAWLKAQGLGIANGLRRIQINRNSFSIIGDEMPNHGWQLFASVQQDYSVALAMHDKNSGGCNQPYEMTYIEWNIIGKKFEFARSEAMEGLTVT